MENELSSAEISKEYPVNLTGTELERLRSVLDSWIRSVEGDMSDDERTTDEERKDLERLKGILDKLYRAQ